MTIGCNIWMIYLKLNRFFYGLSRMLHLSEFVWILRSSVWDVFNNFLLIDATDRSKISSDQKRFFIALSLYPLSFFANTPFNLNPYFSFAKKNLGSLAGFILFLDSLDTSFIGGTRTSAELEINYINLRDS